MLYDLRRRAGEARDARTSRSFGSSSSIRSADRRLKATLAAIPRARRSVWVQDEPKNMGAWSFVRERSEAFLPGAEASLHYVGRAASPSPATGNAAVHKRELEQFLAEALTS